MSGNDSGGVRLKGGVLSMTTGGTRLPRRLGAAGFTLVELMVVAAIVAVLAALILGGVQQARAAARRGKCQSNLRQLLLGMSEYHTAFGCLPMGMVSGVQPPSTSPPWPCTPWTPMLLPWLEQPQLSDAYNFQVGFVGRLRDGLAVNRTVHRTVVAAFLCPADTPRTQRETDSPWPRSKGNYAVAWGNTNWWQTNQAGNDWLGAPFGPDRPRRYADFARGSSHTTLLSELVATVKRDNRGDMWNHDVGASQFYTTLPPNSPLRDVLGASWCDESANPPCESGDVSRTNAYAAARSHHSGGVCVANADGSVQFIANTVDANVWRLAAALQQ